MKKRNNMNENTLSHTQTHAWLLLLKRRKGKKGIGYPLDPLTSIIRELESGVVEELGFEDGVDIEEC